VFFIYSVRVDVKSMQESTEYWYFVM